MYVDIGQSVNIECRAASDPHVTWVYTSANNKSDDHIIVWGGRIYTKDRQRFQVQNPREGVFQCFISRMQSSVAGTYRCQENSGRYPGESCVELTAKGKTK